MVNNPAFPPDEVAAVKTRTLAAIAAQDADWFAQGLRYFRAQYFGPQGSPYRFTPLGMADNVKAFTPEQVAQWYRDHVQVAPRVVAVFGDVTLEQARDLATKLQPPARPKTAPAPAASAGRGNANASAEPSIRIARVEVQQTEQPVAAIFIGFNSNSTVAADERYAIDLADCMVSGYGYPTGYIFDTLRGLGLVYQADAQDMPGVSERLPGAFVAHAGCDPQKVNEVVNLILLNMARLQGSEADVRQDWFERSKRLVVTQDALDREAPEDQAARVALDELYGRGYDAHQRFAQRISAVTLEQVRELARRRLSECVITVCTPRPELVNRTAGMRRYDAFPPVDLSPGGVQHDSAGGAGAK